MHRAVIVTAATVIVVAAPGCVSSIEERSTATAGLGLPGSGGASVDSVIDPASDPDAPHAAHSEAGQPHPALLCVMEVPGTGIALREVDGGIAVVFDTVSRESVADLRRAVRQLGNDLAAGPHDDHRDHHSPRAHELARRLHTQRGALPAMVTAVDDVEGGARLELRAADASQRELVRQRMRAEIEMMQRGVCPLLGQ